MPLELVEDESPETSDSTSGSPAAPWRRLLAWAAADRLRMAILGVSAASALGGMLVLWQVILPAKPRAPLVTLEDAFEALDRRAYDEARLAAEQIRDAGLLSPYRLGELAFILGTVALHEADSTFSSEKTKHFQLAARYLKEARDRGFPKGREADGLFGLGRSLYLSGQIPGSRSVLHEALAVDEERKTEIHRLLADAYLNDAQPKYAEALEQNQAYLGDLEISAAERHQGLVQRAQILLRMGRTAECVRTLDEVPAHAENRADAMVLRGRILLDEARRARKVAVPAEQGKVREKYEAAIKILRQAQGRDTLDTQATRKSMYLIGLCFLEIADPRAALTQFVRTRTMFADTPEGQAASLQEADLQRQFGRDTEALASYRRTLKPIADPKNYSNPWISLDQLQNRMLAAYRHYLDAQKYDVCLKLADLLSPLFSRTRTTEFQAETRRAWGRRLLAQAEHLVPSKAEPLARQGREQLRQAGHAYSRLAKLRIATRQYPEDLWESAVCYLDGQAYRNAAAVFPEYLNVEARRHQSQALVNLGESQLALGQTEDAMASFRECIDLYPRDPLTFKARLLASDACVEQNDLEQAESLLRENLSGDLLTPASKEWRESLFALGRILHGSRRYEEAIRSLEEAVQRYPEAPQAIEGRYLIADACRRIGEMTQEKLRKELVEVVRAVHFKKARECLNTALTQYKQVQELLGRRQEATELLAPEKAMLRNSYFAVGEVLLELEQFDAAVKAYSTAANRYQNAPEVLEAYLQIARAYQRTNRSAEARGILEQAKRVLGRMKPDAQFSETTNFTRQEWSDLLAQLTK